MRQTTNPSAVGPTVVPRSTINKRPNKIGRVQRKCEERKSGCGHGLMREVIETIRHDVRSLRTSRDPAFLDEIREFYNLTQKRMEQVLSELHRGCEQRAVDMLSEAWMELSRPTTYRS